MSLNLSWIDILPYTATVLQWIGWVFLPLIFLPLIYLVFGNSKRLKSITDAIIRTIDSLNYCVGEIIKWALPILVLSVAFSVFALSIFGLSWTKLFESAEYLHAATIMLGAGATLLAGQHVRVDVFHSRMSPQSRAMVDFLGFHLFLAPVCLIIVWNSQSFITFAWMIFEGSPEADGFRGIFLIKTLIPAFAILMILQGYSIALRAAMILTIQHRPERPPNTPSFFHHEEPNS